ncbi:MAG: hypothetical protein FJ042_07025 [Candidatus Cloacimonetes bacterium]|nr:hypothetical protein [Candidatus Cloacimonadota bacterium]
MNFLIITMDIIDPQLIEQLIRLPQASIHFALSPEEALRIMREVKPEIVIIDRCNSLYTGTLSSILSAGTTELYWYEKLGTEAGDYHLGRDQAKEMTNIGASLPQGWLTAHRPDAG